MVSSVRKEREMNTCKNCAFVYGRKCHGMTILKKECASKCENWNNECNCCNCEITKAAIENGFECEHFKPWEDEG